MSKTVIIYPVQYFLYGWLIIILSISCLTDLSQRRIPNLVTYPTIAIVLITSFIAGGTSGLLSSLSGAAVGTFVFLIPYLMGGMGAGDVKLMCGVGAILGPLHTAVALLFIAIAGGIIAAGMLLHRNFFRETTNKEIVKPLRMQPSEDTHQLELSQDGIPYALAITGGLILYYIYNFMK